MLTTCPECRTVFRVGQEQLDDKRGLVRCGRCQAVFNAYDTLLPELASLPGEEVEPETRDEAYPPVDMALYTDDMLAMPPAVASDRTLEPPALIVPEVVPGEADEVAPEAPPETLPEGVWDTTPESAAERPEPAVGPDAAHAVAAPPGPAPALVPNPDDILLTPLVTPASAFSSVWPARLAWGGAVLILALLLLLQLAYYLRDELAAALPGLRPTLERACALAGCDLALARDLTALRIDASSLESDPEDKTRASLDLTLSNRSGQPVAWPHLVLILTDTRDLPMAQRPFAPAEYLPPQAAARPGLEAGREQEARLELELKGLAAFGYKLELAYP